MQFIGAIRYLSWDNAQGFLSMHAILCSFIKKRLLATATGEGLISQNCCRINSLNNAIYTERHKSTVIPNALEDPRFLPFGRNDEFLFVIDYRLKSR